MESSFHNTCLIGCIRARIRAYRYRSVRACRRVFICLPKQQCMYALHAYTLDRESRIAKTRTDVSDARFKLLNLLNSDDEIFCEVGVFSYDAPIKTPPWVIMKSDIIYGTRDSSLNREPRRTGCKVAGERSAAILLAGHALIVRRSSVYLPSTLRYLRNDLNQFIHLTTILAALDTLVDF